MVRPNELSFARRGALNKLAARSQGARPSQLTAVLVGLDPEDDSRAIVSFDGAEVSVLAGPVKMIPGALCAVEVDSANAPVRVLGPVTTRPEGMDEDVPAPAPVMPMPELGPRELTEAEAQAIQDTADGLADAQGRVSAAEGLLDAIGASDGPDGVADVISSYLAIPLDQITIVDNRGADGNVVANLYDAIIVDGLLTASGVITENLLATGAVTSRTLNVVPEEGTGGLKLDAYGMDVVGPDTGEAATFVSFRADSANALQFAQAGNATFTVSPDGNVAAQSVAANHGFTYRGQELADLLAAFPAGVVAHSRMADGTLVHVGGTMSRLTHATFTLPENGGDRMLRFEARLGFGGTALGIVELRAQAGQAVFTTDSGGSTLIGRYYKPISSYTEYITLTAVRSASELGFQPGDTVSIGLMIASNYDDAVDGKYLTVHPSNGQELTVSDLGPAVEPQKPAPYLPAQASGATPAPTGTESQISTSTYTREFSPSWTRSFLGNGSFYNYGAGRAYHGQYLSGNGVLGSMVGFNTTEIQAFIAGGEVTSASVYLENAFTYSSSGMTANWGLHSQSSAPASFTVPAGQWAATFKRGEGRWLGIPRTEYSKFKTGYAAGILLKPPTNSVSSYGYFDGPATRLKITVRK